MLLIFLSTRKIIMQKPFVNTRSHLFLLSANIIYGLNFTIAKGIMAGSIKPIALLAVRTFITAILFWVTSRFLPKEKVAKKDLLYLFCCSLLGVVFNQFFFLKGLSLTTPINSSLILTMNPIAAFIFAAIILKEDISLLKGVGLAVGLSGVVVLILQEGMPELGSSTFTGNLLSLMSTTSWALYTVLIKRMLEKYQAVTVMKWTFLSGMTVSMLLGFNQLNQTQFIAFSVYEWLSLGFVIFFATFLGYLLISSGLKNLSPTVVSIYTYCQPLIATVVASMIGQDKLSVVKIVSGILIFTGVYLVSKKQKSLKPST